MNHTTTTETAADRLLPRLENVRPRGADQWTAACPAHEDRSPSLTIRQIHDRVLVHCWAGCTTAGIVAAVGLTLADLFNDYRPTQPDPVAVQARRVSRGFDRWRSDEVLRTALELRSRDNWLLAIVAAVDMELLTEDEADHWRGVAFDGYSYLEWQFETLLTGTNAEALEVLRVR